MEISPETPARRPAPGPPERLRPAVAARPARVLLACGEPSLAQTLEQVLRGHGEEVAPAGVQVRRVLDGLACLQALELERPDLLVLHASLDRMTGAEVLEAWRAGHPGDRLPVLVLSSLWLADLTPELRSENTLALPCDNLELVERAARLLLAG